MIGLPRIARRSSFLLVLVALATFCGFARADEPTTAPQIDPALKNAVENYWHFGKVARYELAVPEGQKILDMAASGTDPERILEAFEAIAAERQDNIDQWLIRWSAIDSMKDVTGKMIDVVAGGYRARRSSPKFINDQLSRLSINERAYELGITRLRESGELAVPFMINALRDASKRNTQGVVRRALRDLGRYALNPLVAATEMKDWDTLVVIVEVLGDLGYDSAAPYVAKLLDSPETPASVKAAASQTLAHLGVNRSGHLSAADLFFDLGEKIYDQKSSLAPDTRYPQANIWSWKGNTLERTLVPQQIFHELMAMRSCEYALKLGGSKGDDALSLWLAANYRREAELPEGAKDDTRPENYPSAHYWGVEAGTKYLNAALARAIRDRSTPVAFRTIRSLQEIAGQSNLFTDQVGRPLVDAMQFPDRSVRFEAAFALAAALPQTNFEGSQRVMPLLAEALAQTGAPGVVVVMPTQDAVNAMVDQLKGSGYLAAGAVNAPGVVSAAASLPAIDVILVSEDIGPGNVDQLFNIANENVRLAGAARLVMTKTTASLYEPRKVYDSLLSTTTATEAAALKTAIDDARTKIGSLAMDATIATQYATRAGELMLKVGISRGQVYDLSPAKQSLLAALTDQRPDIVKLAGQALGLLNDADAQSGLLIAAMDEKHADDIRISLYKSLATNAKFFGNHLDTAKLGDLSKIVADTANLDVRSAAAEARGALNLPADQAKSLVVGQSKI